MLKKSDDKKAVLKIEKAIRGDKGKYELILTNKKGASENSSQKAYTYNNDNRRHIQKQKMQVKMPLQSQ
jgi:hypothetical protein